MVNTVLTNIRAYNNASHYCGRYKLMDYCKEHVLLLKKSAFAG